MLRESPGAAASLTAVARKWRSVREWPRKPENEIPVTHLRWTMIEWELVSEIRDIETIATGRGLFIRRYLERAYGKGRWR